MQQEQAVAFGTQMRWYRERAGLTQEELAERAGLTTSAVSTLERGVRRRPYPSTVRRLAAALRLSAEEQAALVAAVPRTTANRNGIVPPSPVRPPLSNLPDPRTPLIGRARAAAVLCDLILRHEARLVTLTGVGGSGKTRLALQVAADLCDNFPGGVWFIDFASVGDPALVAQAVATALSVREAPGMQLLDSVVAWLRPRASLLVLDNCEQLIDACAALAERLLAGSPAVRLLTTSREPLQVAGERVWRVPPLDVPDPDRPATADDLAGCPAVQLFVARAQAAVPDFRLTERNAAAVAEVCIRLDGIPLALELAAVRVRVLTVKQIAARLDDALRLLTGGSRAAPTRQQTLRATLDWSYSLLTKPEQAVFRRLAAFAGGCDLEAAEAVCGGADLDSVDVLDLLSRLVDKSLVQVENSEPGMRYHLLEPVRQYAAQHLAACEETEATRARHAACYTSLAEQATPELRGPGQVAWLGRLECERANLRAALRWADTCGDTETEGRLAVALVPFWGGHSHLSEGRRWLDAVLALPPTALSPALRARALIGAGRLAQWQADLVGAMVYLEEGLTSARAAGDRQRVAEALAWLGTVHRRRGAFARAAELLEKSLTLARKLDDMPGMAFALLSLGVTVLNQGDLRRGRALLEACLPLYRQLGDVRYAAIALTMLGAAARAQGDEPRAAALLREGLAGHLETGDRAFIIENLRQWAGVAAGSQPVLATRLLGAGEALREALGGDLAPINRTAENAIVAIIRTQLGDADIAAAWAAGRALTLEQAVTEALASERSAMPSPPAQATIRSLQEALTRRELEVVGLLAQGYTDRQIAAALKLAVSTVGVHVHHILTKLSVHSRWQVADWAASHDLHNPRPAGS